MLVIFKTTKDAYQQCVQGRLHEELFHPFGMQMSNVTAYESMQRVWELRKHRFDVRFRSYVDDMETVTQLYV